MTPASAGHPVADGFARVWSNFLRAPRVQPTAPGDYPQWRRGRRRYFAWVVPIGDSAVRRRHDEARVLLEPWLLWPWHRQPHVTLFVAGFARRRAILDDDVSIETLKAQSGAIRKACRARTQFALAAGALNSFLSAPFVEIHCSGQWVDALRRALADVSREPRFSPYLPHVTVGVYNGPDATRTLSQVLAPRRVAEPLDFNASSVDLVSYDAADVVGELRLEERIAL